MFCNRNAKGMITSITSPDTCRNATYTFDTLNRLTAVTGAGAARYAYDDADNMTHNSGLRAQNPNIAYPTQGVASGHPHSPSSICGTAVSYDANGNITFYNSWEGGLSKGRVIAYDGENRPVSIDLWGNNTAFAYGPDGARASKVNGSSDLSPKFDPSICRVLSS